LIMKKMIAVAAAALVVGVTGEARAQDWFWGGTYSMSMPLSNTKDFNGNFSFRGVAIEGRKVLNENATVGLSFGWHVMNDTQEGTVQLENGAISGTPSPSSPTPITTSGSGAASDRTSGPISA
jgi:hypothetical protein